MFVHLLLTLVFSYVHSQCQAGCIKCSSKDACLMCETWSNRILTNGACVQKTLANCSLQSTGGSCLECKTNFYLDLATMFCISIPGSSVINNCAIYNSDMSCAVCVSGYYIASGNCQQSKNVINSCLYYTNTQKCAKCQNQFILSSDQASCLNPPSDVQNCINYNYIKCLGCNTGYIYNQNNYLYIIFGADLNGPLSDSSILGMINEYNLNYDSVKYPVCTAKNIPNCLTYINATHCAVCSSNFFITQNGGCQAYPNTIISGCSVYTSATNCINCNQGYFLQSNTVCAAITQISNCISFATNLPATVCLACASNYYLSSAVSCSPRIKSLNILNCKQPDPANDACILCNSDFSLTSDNLSCLPSVLECVKYAPSSSTTFEHKCLECGPQFYLNYLTQSCTSGSIINCIQYSPSSNTCLRCNSTLSYLNDGLCISFSTVQNCLAYNPNSPNICRKCALPALPFIKSNACYLILSPIDGCLSYSSATSCTACADGYHLVSGRCNPISASLNCLRITDSGSCIKCSPNYNFFNGLCQPPFSLITQNCASSNINGITSPASTLCTNCITNRYPYNFRNYFMCLESAYAYQITNANFTNCQIVDYSGSEYICILCVPGFFIDSVAKSCVQTCANGLRTAVTVFGMNGSGGNYFPSNSFYCDVPAVSNCLYQMIQSEPSLSNPARISCFACASGFYNEIALSDNVNAVSLNSTGIYAQLFPQTPVDQFPIVTSCVASGSLVNILGTTIVANCEYYYTAGGKTGCIKCLFGFQGTVSLSGSNYFISACTKMINCDGKVQSSGIPLWVNKFLSCHVCADISQIPFLFLSAGTSFTDSTQGLSTYDMTLVAGSWSTATATGVVVNCLSPTNSLFAIDLTKLPLNCGVGLVNVKSGTNLATSSSSLTGVNRANIAALCIVCKPGYTSNGVIPTDNAIPSTPVSQMIGKCNVIPNCQSSTWFNYCSICAASFVYGYLTSTGVQYDNCISFAFDANCLAANIINPVSPVCVFCRPGYSINQDGICEQFTPPNCQLNKFLMIKNLIRIDFGTVLYLAPQGNGCVLCKNGFLSVKMVNNMYVCSTSTYLSAGNFASSTTFVINCNQYGVQENERVVCTLCTNQFVVSLDGRACLPNGALPNCVQAFGISTCSVCGAGYVLLNGACQLPSILNCASYSQSASGSIQICLKCASGFYLNSNACLPGLIPNCFSYGLTGTSCLTCVTGYQLIYAINSLPYCYPLQSSLNCNTYQVDRFQAGVLKCLSCINPSTMYLSSTLTSGDPVSVCINFTSVANCTQYNANTSPGYSSFQCTSCSVGFKLSNNQCVQRTVNIINCLAYATTSDTCTSCALGFYIDLGGSVCTAYPIGLDFCRIYLNQNTCSHCVSNYYYNMTTKKCNTVQNNNLIPNCLYYDSFQSCMTCTTGYFLTSTSNCQLVLAQNCLTVANYSACATCPAMKGLQNQNGLINCVSISDIKCSNFTSSYPFTCLQCITGYYTGSNGICQAVQTTISNCVVYNSATTCSRCASGYVLNNFLSCVLGTLFGPNFDPNCLASQIDGGLYCSSCKGGYYFQNSACVACRASGCYYCNPTNTSSCLMCMSGYYMSATGTCIQWESNKTNTTGFAFALNAFVALYLLFFFY